MMKDSIFPYWTCGGTFGKPQHSCQDFGAWARRLQKKCQFSDWRFYASRPLLVKWRRPLLCSNNTSVPLSLI